MEDDVDALQCAAQRSAITHVALQKLHIARHILWHTTILVHRRRQRIQHPHVVAFGQQQIDRMRADEPGSASYQCFCHCKS